MALKVGELFASFGIDASDLDKALSTIESKCGEIASKMATAGAALSLAVTTPLMKVGKDIYTAGTNFGSQMSRVEAIAGASASDMEKLNSEAIKMGSTTKFTATEAGEALEYMAMAGWKTNQMLDGLAPIMNLAAASGENLGNVSDIVTDALTAMGYQASDAAHFADVLAAASSNSNTNVGLMGETFKYAAPLAGALGYNVEDLAQAIGLMANAGIKSGQAGTALRSILTRLAKPTKESSDAMNAYGISLTNSDGSMKSLMQVMENMRSSLRGLPEDEQAAAAAALGGQEALSGLLAIVNASDEDFNKLSESIRNCEGAADDMAATMLDNAQGDLTILQSAIEGLEISLWQLAEGPFRQIVQGITKNVDAFHAMDSATQLAVLKMGALAAAAGPLLIKGGAIVSMLGKLIPAITALASPVGIVAGAFALFATAAVDANNEIGRVLTTISKKASTSLSKLNKTINTSIQTVSKRIPALAASVREALHEALPGAFDLIGNVVTGMMDTISSNASDIAAIGNTIITDIISGFSRSIPNIIPATANMISSIASALISNIPSLVSAAGELAKAIVDGIMNTDWIGIGKQLLSSIGQALENVGEVFKGWFEKARDAIASINWSTIGTQILDKITVTAESASTKAMEIVSALVDKLKSPEVISGIENITSLAKDIIQKIVVKGTDFLTKATDIVSALVSSIADSGVLSNVIGKAGTSLAAVVTAIANGISDNAGKIVDCAGDLMLELVRGLGEVRVEDAIQSIAKAVTNIANAITDNADKISVAALDLAKELLNGLAEVDWESVSSSLATALNSLIHSIVEWLSDANNRQELANAAASIADGIASGLTDGIIRISADANQHVSEAFMNSMPKGRDANYIGEQWSSEWINAFADGVKSGSMSNQQLIAMAVALIGQGWGDEISNLAPEVSSKAEQLFDNVYRSMSNGNIMANFRTFGIEITGELAAAIGQGQLTVETAARALGVGLNEQFILSMNELELKEYLNQYFSETSTEVSDLLKNSATDWGSIFGQAIPEGASIGLENGMYVLRSKTGEVIDLVSSVNAEATVKAGNKKTAKAGIDAMSKTTADGETQVQTSAQTVVDAMEEPFGDLPDDTKAQCELTIEAIKLAIEEGQPSAVTAIETAAKAIVERFAAILSSNEGNKIATTFFSGVRSGISSARGSIESAARSAGSGAKSAASSVLSHGAGSSVGYNFAAGIASGIRSGAGAVRNAAASIASAAVSAAKSRLKIHSPSAVAREEIGEMYDQGLGLGMLDMIPYVVNAGHKVVDALLESTYIDDPGRGTVYTAKQQAKQAATETAAATGAAEEQSDKYDRIGRAIADRLIESGALDSEIYMDKDKVGQKTSKAVSREIKQESQQTVTGRSAQGVVS